jgi:hypothetical protein
VAHVCNPSYSGHRDQEDRSLKLAQVNSLQDLILKKTHYKSRAGGVAQGVGLSSNKYHQKKSNK